MMITLAAKEATAMPVYAPGTAVSYLSRPATVIHGNAVDEWSATGQPSDVVNIRFDNEVRGHSRQFDVYATDLICL